MTGQVWSAWRRGALALLLAVPMACAGNPFNPSAQLVVITVTPPAAVGAPPAFAGVIGIALDRTTDPPSYLYADPQIIVQNAPKAPEAYLDQALIAVTIGDVTLPTKRLPLTVVVPRGGTYTGTVPFLRGNGDIRNAVFPNGTPNRSGAEGVARVTLTGRDKNGNEVTAAFNAPLTFVTITASTSPLPAPTVAPAPASTPVPAATPAPVSPSATP